MMVFLRINWSRIIIVSALTLTLITSTALASQLDAKRSELHDVKAKIDENRNLQQLAERRQAEILRAIQQNDEQIAQLEIELTGFEEELEATTQKRQSIEVRLNELQDRLDSTKDELAATQEKLEQRREAYNKRLVSTYKDGGSAILKALLKSTSLNDAAKRTVYIASILERDNALIHEMNELIETASEKIAQIETDKEIIAEQQQALVDEENRITELKNNIIEKQILLQSEIQAQKTIFAKVQEEKIALEHAEERLRATSNLTAGEIKRLERGNSGVAPGGRPATSSGFFMRPVSGPITSKFGNRYHPILKKYRLHAGVDFGVPTGTSVYAAQSGTVAMAGWRGGYGYAVVINHGNGMTTLYGHNSKLFVRPGQRINKGQAIAHSGSTGLSTGPHLHFEVRVNGTPVDPLKWF